MSVNAYILAGGKSTRMGRSKLTLPLGNKTVLERVVEALKKANEVADESGDNASSGVIDTWTDEAEQRQRKARREQ